MNKTKYQEGVGLSQRLYYILKEVERMANKIFNTRVKNKRDTEANWTSKNPVLLNGEIAIVDTTSGETRFKVGDDTKRYSQLPFQDAATLANYVKTTRKINNKALSSDISLTASDVGALPSTTTALKNPHALTFTGAVTGSYDGSAAKSVAIPSVDSSLSSTSTNAIQNKAVNTALSGKASTAVATTSANGLMSASDKTKLNGIAIGANKTTVDSALSTTSTNPVQNKAVKAALDSKLNTSGGTLTGNLTGQYLTGTWLQTTDATDLGSTPSKVAVLDGSGLVYSRTLAELKSDIGVDTATLVDLFYPIGSIYMSTDTTNPQSRFTGTYWLPIYNRFLLGAGDTYKAGTMGGEATHTLTRSEIPSHYHDEYLGNDGGPDSAPSGYSGWPSIACTSKKTWWARGSKTSAAGGDGAHNNMPPYLAVYMWRRVTHQEYEAGADGG